MRVVAVHGIGDHATDFHQAWAEKMHAVLPRTTFDVVGLHWSDDQDRVAARYPALSARLAETVAGFGLGAIAAVRSSSAYEMLHKSLYDVFAYSALHDMRHYLQTQALLKLLKLTEADRGATVLVAHSLGCALAAHLAQLVRRITGAIPFRALVMLAPPFGIQSPLGPLPDPLTVTPDSSRPTSLHGGLAAVAGATDAGWATARDYNRRPDPGERLRILDQICSNWRVLGRGRLRFCVNTLDIICSDVAFTVGNQRLEIVPFKTGYADAERQVIERRAMFHQMTFGAPELGSLGSNHQVLTYLEQPAVVAALEEVLA